MHGLQGPEKGSVKHIINQYKTKDLSKMLQLINSIVYKLPSKEAVAEMINTQSFSIMTTFV